MPSSRAVGLRLLLLTALALVLAPIAAQVQPGAPWGEFAVHTPTTWRTSENVCKNPSNQGGAAMWVVDVSTTISSSAAIDVDGTVYFGADADGSGHGTFYALDGETGEIRWTARGGDHFASSPAIGSNGLVYTGCNDGNVYAFNASSGETAWSTSLDSIVYSSPTLNTDGSVFACSLDVGAARLQGDTGATIWAKQTSCWATPALLDNQALFMANFDGGTLSAWDLQTGDDIFQIQPFYGRTYATPAILAADGVIVWAYETGQVVASSTSNGTTLWTFEAGAPVSSFSILNGIVYFGSQGNQIIALSVNDGSVIWSFATPAPVLSSPVPTADGFLYVGCSDDHLYALSSTTGELIWRYQTQSNMRNSPVIDALGNILIGDDSGHFHKISCGSAPAPPGPPPPSCGAPDIANMRSECGGKVYDFGCLYPGPAKYFNDTEEVFGCPLFMQLVDGGFPNAGLPLCPDPVNGNSTIVGFTSRCFGLGLQTSTPWGFTPGTSSSPQSFGISLEGSLSDKVVEIVCDPKAVTPVATFSADARQVATIQTVLACEDYVPSSTCPQSKVTNSSVHALTPCKMLSLDVGNKKRVKSYGRMLDINYLPEKQNKYVMTRSDYASCSLAQPVFQLSVELAVVSGSPAQAMAWNATSATVFIGTKASALATTLNAQCPCGGNYIVGAWRTVSSSSCPPLPPAGAHWLCWIMSGSPFVSNFDQFGLAGYARSMLNTSVVESRNPEVDSPVFQILAGDKYGNATECDVTLWNQCGGVIAATVTDCAGIPAGPLQELCLLSGYTDSIDFSLKVCCACVERYADANHLAWSRLKCAT